MCKGRVKTILYSELQLEIKQQEVVIMNVYTTDKIRNVVLLGHGGAGKTSLVESMA